MRVDEDGVKTVRTAGVRSTVWLLAAAIVVVGLTLLLGLRFFTVGTPTRANESRPEDVAGPKAGRRATRSAGGFPRKVVPRQAPARPVSVSPAAADAKPAPGRRDAVSDDATAEAPAEDEPTGIALFPPPGTDPPKSGIIVPEDFALPEGYVRHHQVTDDGRPLPPILMFHPDYEFVDENGVPVEIPEDRVVPPEMAPSGLTVEMLDVPAAQIPMIEPDDGSSAAEPQG
jgi:hypothetical protein